MSAPPCPCDSGRSLSDCCGPLHAGAAAKDAEALMRSRYSAYVLANADYLMRTWHANTRPDSLELSEPGLKWLGLEVKRHDLGATDRAMVEFVARFRVGGGKAQRLHERSRFVCEADRWLYLDANG